MRVWHLRSSARAAFESLTPHESATVAVIAEMIDERVPLVRPEARSVTHGSAIMGRAVPGTSLMVCYVPAGLEFFVVNIQRLR